MRKLNSTDFDILYKINIDDPTYFMQQFRVIDNHEEWLSQKVNSNFVVVYNIISNENQILLVLPDEDFKYEDFFKLGGIVYVLPLPYHKDVTPLSTRYYQRQAY